MKRWILRSGANSVDGLVLEDADIPVPGAGEVRVRVHAAAFNFRDHLVLGNAGGGWRTERDLIPLADGAGVIDAVGDGVTQWSVGDRVTTVYLRDFATWPPHPDSGIGLGSLNENGVLAEYVVLRATRVTKAPDNLTLAEASTIPCAAVTAWTALRGAYPLERGQKALMLGSGGVSLFAVTMAKAMGAEVFVTSSREDKARRLKNLGVAATFDYKADSEWGKSVFNATNGVDKVVNTAGFGSINQCVQAVSYGGDIAMVGLMTFGDMIDPGLFLAKGTSLRGIPVGCRQQHEQAVNFIESNAIKPIIYKAFEFEDAKSAYDAQLSPDVFGKVIIKLSDD